MTNFSSTIEARHWKKSGLAKGSCAFEMAVRVKWTVKRESAYHVRHINIAGIVDSRL